MKNITLLWIAVLFSAASAFAQGGTTGPLTWNLNNDVLIINGEGDMPDYEWYEAPWTNYMKIINTVIIDDGVTTIGNYAFPLGRMTSVFLPNSITRIGDYAFYYCDNLTSITIPDNVTTIGIKAFSDCDKLPTITIPAGVTSIGVGAINGVSLLSIEVESENPSYTSEDGVLLNKDKTTLMCFPGGKSGEYAVPNSVTRIEDYAFSSCMYITSIAIPGSVTAIGKEAFSFCIVMTSIEVESNNPSYVSEDGVLFDKDKTTLICYPGGKKGAYVIPDGVTRIENLAFSFCQGLTSVTIPNSVTIIENEAFNYCISLASITLSNTLTTIGDLVFCYCIELTSITIPNSVTSIENGAFAYCQNLASITLSNNLTSIGEYAFINCTNLSSITIPNTVTTIGEAAFAECTKITSVTLPDNLTTIGDEAFYGCTSLGSINIPDGVTTIGNGVFFSCGIISMNIPNSVKSIGKEAFASCAKLLSITIPDGVTTIGDEAFFGCTNLTSITFSNTITSIGEEAFANCAKLTTITNLNHVPVDIDPSVFQRVPQRFCDLKVPANAVSDYQNASVWKEFNIIGGDYYVQVSANNDVYGYVIGNELYPANATATVTATVYPDYKFVKWTKNGVEVSTDNPYNFTVTENVELIAHFESTVGVVETPLMASLRVFPNPTSGELTIDCGNVSKGACPLVEIYDIMGQRVATVAVGVNNHSPLQTTTNISHLPPGVYFIRLQTEKETITQKIIKN